MAKNQVLFVICTCLSLFLSGCSTYGTLIEENQSNILKISPGLTNKEVVEIMGTREATVKSTHVSNPYKRDFFSLDNDQYEILYYLTRRYSPFTAVKESQATPVVIKNGKVIGLGIEALNRVKGGK